MAARSPQGQLFSDDGVSDDTSVINGRCVLRTSDGHRLVVVAGVPVAHFAVDDRMAEAHARVSLVDQGHASQVEVARAFRCSTRTVRRDERRFEDGGLVALGRRDGYPAGKPRMAPSQRRLVEKWKAAGVAHHEIARRLGITPKAVRKLLRRLGWTAPAPEQVALPLVGARGDPNLSALAAGAVQEACPPAPAGGDPNLSGSPVTSVGAAEPAGGITPPSESSSSTEDVPPSFDSDPADRRIDRLLAAVGLLDDAAPRFRPGSTVPHGGVLLALPALVDSGVFDIARRTYGSIGPAFYGLRTSLVALLLMALSRIKSPEAIKRRSPVELGRLLGLDRAPEVKTLRRKLSRLADLGRATEFGRALAERRVATVGDAVGFLYVDGHVRVYHGKHALPKAHVARMRIAMPATSDYWINDQRGDPLLVVTAEANAGMVKMLPTVLAEVRSLVGERRVTIVFDRGGYSPKLFAKLIASGFDILTYRKGRSRRVPRKHFHSVEATFDGHKVSYQLADQSVRLLDGKLRLRQVTRLSEPDHQTPILTSRLDLPAVEVAFRMFERWRQENFFKYLRQEYALDALVDYDVVADDPARLVPNPARAAADARWRAARAELAQLEAEYGVEAFTNLEGVRPTMRGFKIANGALGKRLLAAVQRVCKLRLRRDQMPVRVPVKNVRADGEVVKLATEKKHLTSLLKMVAYQAESDLVRLIVPHFARADDEGRSLVQSILSASADFAVDGNELRVTVAALSAPRHTRALAALCEDLNRKNTCFPGSRLRLRYAVAGPP